MPSNTYLVRLKPYDPQQHCKLRTYAVAGVRFTCGHWFKVEADLAHYLRAVTQPDSPQIVAFDVCTEDEARALVAREKAAKRPKAPGDELRLRRARRRVSAMPVSLDEIDDTSEPVQPPPTQNAKTERPSTVSTQRRVPVGLTEELLALDDQLPTLEEDVLGADSATTPKPPDTESGGEPGAAKPPTPKPKQKKKRKSK